MTFQDENTKTNCHPLHHRIDVPKVGKLEEEQNESMFYIGNEDQEEVSNNTSSWRNDLEHDLSHDHECSTINNLNHQEEDQMHRIVVDRPASPTSAMMDISQEDEDETISEVTDSVSSSSTLHRSVSWKATIVTEVMYRPATQSREKKALFYNSADMQRFKQHYKMQVRAAQEYQKRLRKDSLLAGDTPKDISKVTKQQHQHHPHLYTNPISGFINMVTAYLTKASPSQPSLSLSTSNTSNNTLSSRGPIAETCVLVDTLYLF